MGSPRVLLVDADQDQHEILSAFLAVAGYAVDNASSGTEALRLVGLHAPNVVVTEWRLPDEFQGTGTRSILADSRLSGIPVIVCTADAFAVLDGVTHLPGVYATLTKPCPPRRIVHLVDGAIAYAKAVSQGSFVP